MYPGGGQTRLHLPDQEGSTKHCLHCSDVDPKLLVAGSERGSVLGWNLKTRISTILKTKVFEVRGGGRCCPRSWAAGAGGCHSARLKRGRTLLEACLRAAALQRCSLQPPTCPGPGEGTARLAHQRAVQQLRQLRAPGVRAGPDVEGGACARTGVLRGWAACLRQLAAVASTPPPTPRHAAPRRAAPRGWPASRARPRSSTAAGTASSRWSTSARR
jgi:hypothetical protein